MAKRSRGKSGGQKYPKKGKSFSALRGGGCPSTIQDKVRDALRRELEEEHRESKRAAVEDAFDEGIKLAQDARINDAISAMVETVGRVAAQAIARMERTHTTVVEKANKRKVVVAREPEIEEEEEPEDSSPRFEQVPREGGGFWLRRVNSTMDPLVAKQYEQDAEDDKKAIADKATPAAVVETVESHEEDEAEAAAALQGEVKVVNDTLENVDQNVEDIEDAIRDFIRSQATYNEQMLEQTEDGDKAIVKKLRDVDSSVDGVRRRLTFQTFMSAFGDMFSGLLGKFGGMFNSILGGKGLLGLLGKGGLVGAVGAASYGVGSLLNKGLNSVLESKTGTSLGGNIYEMFHDEDMTTKDKEAEALAYFQRKGWSPEQAAGIVANLKSESSTFDPGAEGDSGKAYGIGQWHPDRQARFEKKFKKPIQGSSFQEQLEFVDSELNNEEKRAGDLLRETVSASKAGQAVSKYYERPRDDLGFKMRSRGDLAEQIHSEMRKVPQPNLQERKEKDAVDYDKLANTIAKVMPKPESMKSVGPAPNTTVSAARMPVRPEDLGLAIANAGVYV